MAFLKKSTFFSYVFFNKKSQKEPYFDILDRKECFLDLKSKVLTRSKNIDILQRGQSMVFVKKSTFFLYVFLTKKTQKERFFDILDRKQCLLDLKSEFLKRSTKSTFCKGVSPWFSLKMDLFLICSFEERKPERNTF